MQAACYGAGFCEPRDVWQARLAATAAHWRVAHGEGGELRAYLAAYPSVRGAITALNGPFVPAVPADTLYLHDLAVHPAAAGRGLGLALVAVVLAQARDAGLRQATLVAVEGAADFWKRLGFAPAPLDDAAACQALAAYGSGAVHMRRAVDTPYPPLL